MSKIKRAMLVAEEQDSEEWNRAWDTWNYEKIAKMTMDANERLRKELDYEQVD